MNNRRILLACFALCLPALAFCAFCAYFLEDKVPKIVSAERSRETAAYRTTAAALATNGVAATWRGERQKGWRERGKVKLADGTRTGWGFVSESNDLVLVWLADRGAFCGTRIPSVDIGAVSGLLQVGACFAMVVSVSLTFFCLWFFLRTLKARDDFLAATAHDLTTPLVGLRRLVGRDDAEAKDVVERLMRLVANLKDFLRLGGRRPAPARETFSIGGAFDAAYALFAADYAEENSGPVTVSGDRTLVVCADETLVVQILWNLLGNDLKYAAPHGPVSVGFRSCGRHVAVEFADVGPGMRPRERRRAFDRYYRAKTVLESGKGGFGIGLCTAREFARAMGGDLTVRANEPHGCVFTLKLPSGAAR